MEAIRKVFPNAVIKKQKNNEADGLTTTVAFNGSCLWQATKENLFAKNYQVSRNKAIVEISEAVSQLLQPECYQSFLNSSSNIEGGGEGSTKGAAKGGGCAGDICERANGGDNRWFY